MKTTIILPAVLSAALTFSAGICLAAQPDSSGNKAGKEDQTGKISEYFNETLSNGFGGGFMSRKSIKSSDVEKVRAEIWELWKKANASFDEEKLPELRPLDWDAKGNWHIPAVLEPDAEMSYYWGSKGEMPEGGYRTFIYLHGSGNRENEWRNGLILSANFDDSPSAYLVPRIPNTGSYYRWWQKGKQYVWEKFLRQAMLTGKTDPDRIFFIGISEGAYGSQRLASFYADYLAGAGPIAGGEPLKNAPVENCANLAFSFRTGTEDKTFYRDILTGYTKDAFDKFAADCPEYYVHNVELVQGADHHTVGYFETTPWLRDHVRNPYPRFVNWENFEMDGLKRRGFHNIRVLGEPASLEGRRRHYVMEINDNEIEMQVGDVEYKTIQTDPVYGIEMKFEKTETPGVEGRFIIYLSDELVNLDKKVTVRVNGRTVYRGVPKRRLENVVNSCALFYDPHRLYTAAVEVDLSR